MQKIAGFVLTEHAKQVLVERKIAAEWIEQVLQHPEKIENDQMDPELRHALARINKYGDRVLRVVFNEKSQPKRIITAYFDRKMKDKL